MEAEEILREVEKDFIESPTIEEVKRNDVAILYESIYSSNGCPIDVLKEYFPDYEFNEQREYLIEIDGILYDGDSLMEKYYQG